MARPARKTTKYKLVVPIILIISAIGGLLYHYAVLHPDTFSLAVLYRKLIFPLSKLILFLGVGLFVGLFVEAMGWTRIVAQRIRPMTKWGNLKDESGAAFVSSFVSGVVANAMLMDYYKSGRITRKELVLTYLLNNGLPVYMAHFPTTLFIVTSLAGMAGAVYLGITLAAAIMRSLCVLIYSRISFPPQESHWSALVDHLGEQESMKEKVLKRFRDRFIRLVLYTVPIYVLIFLLNEWGGFKILREGAAGILPKDCFPVEAVGLIMFSLAAEFSSGMAAAGALINTGALTVKQTALALIAGTIVSTPIRAIRHQLPAYAGLFDLGLGSELLFLSQFFRIISLLLISIPYALMGQGDVCTIQVPLQ